MTIANLPAPQGAGDSKRHAGFRVVGLRIIGRRRRAMATRQAHRLPARIARLRSGQPDPVAQECAGRVRSMGRLAMNGDWRCVFACASMALALLFTTSHVIAAPANPQVLHAFCHPSRQCTDAQDAFGFGAQDVIAGPDGAYYGTTYYSNTIRDENGNLDGGGSVYRADPLTGIVSVLYQFPEGYYPAYWLKAGPDGYLYGGYRHAIHANAEWLSEGFFRLSLEGEFTIIRDETAFTGFACNAPVRDSLGNLIGITPNIVYKVTLGGDFKVLHKLAAGQYFGCPNYEPALAADGNLYGVFVGSTGGNTSGAIYRITPDDAFTILHDFDAATEGVPSTPLTLGPEGALYGVSLPYDAAKYTMYRMSLDGQFTNLGAFGPEKFSIAQKLTLMPDGYFYGSGRSYGRRDDDILFRLSPAAEYTQLYVNPGVASNSSISMMIRGFDNALYGSSFYDGKYGGGVLFRFVPPAVQ
ncbi:MAG: hypothetical protein JSS21_01580 [Proteobacteria bacterium]|nr:hypothetical protein [Pseudomonadota bacterium]